MAVDDLPVTLDAKKKFAAYIFERFVSWKSAQFAEYGGPPSKYNQRSFARWLEIDEGELSRIMSASRLPQGNSVHCIAKRLGPEVYDLLDMPRMMPKDSTVYQLVENWHLYPDRVRDEIRSIAEEWEKNAGKNSGDATDKKTD